jgi:hypothetical protein
MVQDAAGLTADPGRKAQALALVTEALAEVPKPYTGWFELGRDSAHALADY